MKNQKSLATTEKLSLIRNVALLSAVSVSFCQFAQAGTDLIFHNGNIHTMDEQHRVVSAIAISDNKILKVGDDKDILGLKDDNTKVVDLNQRMVMPGMFDDHVHIGVAADYTDACSLRTATTKQEMIDLMKTCEQDYSGEGWLWGFGFNPQVLGDVNFTLEELDKVFPKTPIAMVSIQHGRSFINSAALKHIGYGEQEGDLTSKDFVRDANGKPTGRLLGDKGFLRLGLLGGGNINSLKKELNKLSSHGYTSFFDAGIFVEDYKKRMQQFVELDKKGELPARANLSLVFGMNGGEYSDKVLADYVALKKEIVSPRVKLESIKVFGDADPHMIEPYTNGQNSPLLMSKELLEKAVPAATAKGFGFHIHVMGDATTRDALNIFEKTKGMRLANAPRHTLAHFGFVHPDDLPRFKELDVVANISAVWAYPNSLSYLSGKGPVAELIGKERMQNTMPFKSLAENGAVLASSSDYPFSELNPFKGIEVGVTRSNPNKDSQSYLPKQRVSLDTMLDSYTINAAYQMGQENVVGSLERGKFADLIVLNQDLYKIDPKKISDTKVLLTVMGGKVVHKTDEGAQLMQAK